MIWLTVVLAGIAVWLAIWAGSISLAGWMGWKPLAKEYPGSREPEGQRLTWQGVHIGASNYNGVITVVLNEDGIYLRPVRLFAYNHPPIQIPWSAIRSAEPGFFGRLKLRLDNGKTLSMRGRASKVVQEWLDRLDAEPIKPMNEPLLSLEEERDASVEETEQRGSWRRMRER